ncbi:MAG TPA: ROK family protein [Pseudogracilibacillus sp.]|nr:ROK family protein [Pseudogracilibacillus sp.]
MGLTVAIDIGGTKIASGIINDENEWLVTDKHESDTESEEAMFQALLNSIHLIIDKAQVQRDDITEIGVTVPGQINVEEGIAIYANNLPWRNFDLKAALEAEFPNQKLVFEHDVVAAAYGEWAIRQLSDELFLYKTVSTGICASIIYRGEAIRGTGTAGEVGLIPMQGRASLEDLASGPAMERAVQEIDPSLSLKDAFDRWEKGDTQLNELFQEKALNLARGVYTLLSVFDAHVLSLGGGVLNNQKQFFDLMMEKFQALCIHPFQKEWHKRIEGSHLAGKSGLYGVAMKAKRNE